MRTTRKSSITKESARTLAVGLCLLLTVGATAPAAAEEAMAPSATSLRLQDGVLSLSLEEAISIALERNLSLAVERYRRTESDLQLGGRNQRAAAALLAYTRLAPRPQLLRAPALHLIDWRSV